MADEVLDGPCKSKRDPSEFFFGYEKTKYDLMSVNFLFSSTVDNKW